MARIRTKGPKFTEIVPELRTEYDLALEVTLNIQQDALGEANPKDTGRMASSWVISKGGRSRAVRPVDWAPKNAQRYEKFEYPRRITFDGQYYLVNNVPYADRIALDYPGTEKASRDWYTSIANQTGNVFEEQLRQVQS